MSVEAPQASPLPEQGSEPTQDPHLDQLTLYRSHLGSSGPRYEPLERVQLEGSQR